TMMGGKPQDDIDLCGSFANALLLVDKHKMTVNIRSRKYKLN
ncbi:MAG: hypothetical protein RL151_1086, partial [Bacteroidota bacterium]